MRGILVGGAVLTGIVAAVFGYWLVTVVMAVAVAAHAALWVWLRRSKVAGPAAPGASSET